MTSIDKARLAKITNKDNKKMQVVTNKHLINKALNLIEVHKYLSKKLNKPDKNKNILYVKGKINTFNNMAIANHHCVFSPSISICGSHKILHVPTLG